MFLLVFVCSQGEGVCLQKGRICLQRAVCLQGEGSAYRGRGLPTEESRGDLPTGIGIGVYLHGGGQTPEPEKRAVRFLLECFLVHINCSFITLNY